MIEGIEPLYQQIAEAMADALPEHWQTAWMDAIFYSEHTFYSAEYMGKEGEAPKSFPTDRRGRRAFEEIRDKFVEAKQPLWCRARFELHADGKFKMNWGYDDCDEKGFARFDEKEELERMRKLRERLK